MGSVSMNSIFLQVHTALQLRRPTLVFSHPWERQIASVKIFLIAADTTTATTTTSSSSSSSSSTPFLC
jgi:hypothetical protein